MKRFAQREERRHPIVVGQEILRPVTLNGTIAAMSPAFVRMDNGRRIVMGVEPGKRPGHLIAKEPPVTRGIVGVLVVHKGLPKDWLSVVVTDVRGDLLILEPGRQGDLAELLAAHQIPVPGTEAAAAEPVPQPAPSAPALSGETAMATALRQAVPAQVAVVDRERAIDEAMAHTIPAFRILPHKPRPGGKKDRKLRGIPAVSKRIRKIAEGESEAATI